MLLKTADFNNVLTSMLTQDESPMMMSPTSWGWMNESLERSYPLPLIESEMHLLALVCTGHGKSACPRPLLLRSGKTDNCLLLAPKVATLIEGYELYDVIPKNPLTARRWENNHHICPAYFENQRSKGD